ncbi:hypothetical protein BGX38DRAFT_1175178 [Terfezia claveryi]|nr:hypothetical protein BGX38DRAFT_1175178 [Terfezia claveryi]
MIIDLGSDFPPHMLTTLKSLNTSSIFRHTPHRLTTHGWNKYGSEADPDFRAFKYLTPKMRVEVKDYFGEGGAGWVGVRIRALHMICSPERAGKSVRELWTLLDQADAGLRAKPRPLVLWEPIPDLCTPETREEMFDAASLVDVVSPNDGELAGFHHCVLAPRISRPYSRESRRSYRRRQCIYRWVGDRITAATHTSESWSLETMGEMARGEEVGGCCCVCECGGEFCD